MAEETIENPTESEIEEHVTETEGEETDSDEIAELRAIIEQQNTIIDELRTELARAHNRIDGHEREHAESTAVPRESSPDERHPYFRRIGGGKH